MLGIYKEIMCYTYRKAKNKDKDGIYELYQTVMMGHVSKIWGWDEVWQKNDFLSHYRADGITMVFKANELVGYSQVEDKNDQLFMRMLLIMPVHQNKGIGKRLMKSFKANGDKCSKLLSLEVFKINSEARKFYEKHGFNIVGETKSSYIMVSNA